MPMNPEKYEALKSLHRMEGSIRRSHFFSEEEKAEELEGVYRDIVDAIDPPVDYFLDHAAKGKQPGCSDAERAAARLAQVVTEYAGALDEKGAKGLLKFVEQTLEATKAANVKGEAQKENSTAPRTPPYEGGV